MLFSPCLERLSFSRSSCSSVNLRRVSRRKGAVCVCRVGWDGGEVSSGRALQGVGSTGLGYQLCLFSKSPQTSSLSTHSIQPHHCGSCFHFFVFVPPLCSMEGAKPGGPTCLYNKGMLVLLNLVFSPKFPDILVLA